jgi:DNA-binding IclR family transcriptional regulator
VAIWTFLTYHARVLLFVAHDPGARLRDIAASLNITERSAFGILTDLVEAATATTSRHTSRCQNRTGGNAPSGRSWP